MTDQPQQPYHHLSSQDVTDFFKSDLDKGLTAEEIASLYKIHGRNELESKPGKPVWLRFLLQFNEPLLYILLIAGAIKALLGSWTNAIVIWGVTLINAIIGYIQESKAEGAIASLAKTVTTETTVLREGQTQKIPSAVLNIKDSLTTEFEAAFEVASSIITAMPGYVSHELQRCIETENRYLLLVRWQKLEDHTIGFRQSAQYQEWRALLHHFYDSFPVVEHYIDL